MDDKLLIIFFWLALMTYAAAFIFYVYLFVNKRRVTSLLATSLTCLGFAFHTVAFVAHWISVGHLPLDGPVESYFMFAWSLVLIYLSLEWLTKLKVLGAWVLPFVVALLTIAWIRFESLDRLSHAVRNSWVAMHVSVVFFAYAGFTIAAVSATLYLIQQRQLKKRTVNLFFRRLPSLEVLDDLSNKAIAFALPFMTMTIATGLIRAVKAVPHWYLDPVVLTASLTWVVYGAYLGLRYLGEWQGRRIAYVAIAGFLPTFMIMILRFFPVFHRFGT
jgi:ABC-type transport system involved in cytochrome c biogenesis permease subunit